MPKSKAIARTTGFLNVISAPFTDVHILIART